MTTHADDSWMEGEDQPRSVRQAERYLMEDAPPPALFGDEGIARTAHYLRDICYISQKRAVRMMCRQWPTYPRKELREKVRDAYADDGVDFLDLGELSRGLQPLESVSTGLRLNSNMKAADTYDNAVQAVAITGLMPAWDELKQVVVFRAPELPWPEPFGRLLNDHVLRMVRDFFIRQFESVSYAPTKDNIFEALMFEAYRARFNPVVEYLDSLTWDGVKRVERLFSDYFNCGDDAYTRAVSVCHMVASVRRVRHPGCKYDTMPILKGRQGWLKSTAVRTLYGSDWYSDADLGTLRDKDAAMKLRGVWCQEFAEIDSLTRAETGALKAFCSRATDRQRDPYDRVVTDVKRACVFLATVNEGGYLKDTTGARRFWPLEVRAPIDVAKIEADRDQLWAEAAVLEAQGVSDVLPHRLWQAAAERQEDQTSDDPWGDTLAHYLEQRTKQEPDEDFPALPPDRVHTSELFDALSMSPAEQTKDRAQRLRVVMEARLGWQYRRSVRILGKVGGGYVRAQV